MTTETTVFVVDDDQAVRRSLDMLLTASGLNVKTFASCEEFLAQYESTVLGCLILDIRLPGMNGLELLSLLSQRNSCLPVIIVTGHGDVPITVEAFKKGAVDFVQKPYRDYELLASIKKAIQKSQTEYSKNIYRKNLGDKINALSAKERQILGLIVEGYSDKQIGAHIGISQRAVAHHRQAIFNKFEVNNAVKLTTMVESLWVTV